jgi:hypothetical protein
MRWYDEEGIVREATLATARKEHYYPPVTGVLDVISKPAVDKWKQNIIISEAVSLNPIFADHEMEEFRETVLFRANIKFTEAAKLGTEWHSLLINHFLGVDSESDLPAATIHAIDEKLKDLNIHLEQHEVPFVLKEEGYAGTIDAIGYRLANDYKISLVLDWKTQATNGRSPRYYESWPMQLAAYANSCYVDWTMTIPNYELWNVVLSTTDPGKVWFKRWKNADAWLELFNAAQRIWCALNNYNPSTGGKYFDE